MSALEDDEPQFELVEEDEPQTDPQGNPLRVGREPNLDEPQPK